MKCGGPYTGEQLAVCEEAGACLCVSSAEQEAARWCVSSAVQEAARQCSASRCRLGGVLLSFSDAPAAPDDVPEGTSCSSFD